MLRNSFSLNTSRWLLIVAMSVYGSKIQDVKKKCIKNFIEYFSHNKNGMAKCVAPKHFSAILSSKILGIRY